MKKFLTPFIYAIFAIAVFFTVVFLVFVVERTFGLHTAWGRIGDIDGLLSLVFFGGAIFVFANIFIGRLEGALNTPMVAHFRQSILLYVFLILLSPTLLSFFGQGFNSSARSVVFVIATAVAAYGIVVNAFFLFVRQRHAKNYYHALS